MKIRIDFVTNSSSSSYVRVLVKDERLAKALGYHQTNTLNKEIEQAVEKWFDVYGDGSDRPPFSKMASLEGLLALLAINIPELKEEASFLIDTAFENDEDVKEQDEVILAKALDAYKEKNAISFSSLGIEEGTINGLIWDLYYEDDGDYPRVLYVKIENGKRTEVNFETYETNGRYPSFELIEEDEDTPSWFEGEQRGIIQKWENGKWSSAED